MGFVSAVIFAAALSGAGQAGDMPRHVTVIASEPARPQRSEVEYQVQCTAHRYLLTVNYLQDLVTFSVDGTPVQSELAATPLGKALKAQPLFGHWGFACAKNGLVMDFFGFNTADAGGAQPVSLRGDIQADGTVGEGSQLEPVSIDLLRQSWHERPAK